MRIIAAAIIALAFAGCGDQPTHDTRPRAESAGSIAMPLDLDAQVVVLPTGERVLVMSKRWPTSPSGYTATALAAVLLPPVAAKGKGVGP